MFAGISCYFLIKICLRLDCVFNCLSVSLSENGLATTPTIHHPHLHAFVNVPWYILHVGNRCRIFTVMVCRFLNK